MHYVYAIKCIADENLRLTLYVDATELCLQNNNSRIDDNRRHGFSK